jgi:ubiquinone/menaquinone biosynthesis C-methylase UbiE
MNDSKEQYDKLSKKFISAQKEYFSKKIDQARVFIKKQLPDLKGKVILDVGCGHGVDIVNYEKMGASEVFGIDSSKAMIEEAKKIVNRKENLFVGSMENMPFKNSQFDVIVGRFSIHYLPDLDKTYEEFSRVLKKKGILVLVAHHPFLGFMQLGAKSYGNKDLIKMNLYNNAVPIKFPNHTLKEYFSDKFFEHFIIDYLDEEKEKDAEYHNQWKIPGFIAFRAVKR